MSLLKNVCSLKILLFPHITLAYWDVKGDELLLHLWEMQRQSPADVGQETLIAMATLKPVFNISKYSCKHMFKIAFKLL